MVIQNFDMKVRGVGWLAEPCPSPDDCADEFCFPSEHDCRRVHPVDPIEFRKWKKRSNVDEIPEHLKVTDEE